MIIRDDQMIITVINKKAVHKLGLTHEKSAFYHALCPATFCLAPSVTKEHTPSRNISLWGKFRRWVNRLEIQILPESFKGNRWIGIPSHIHIHGILRKNMNMNWKMNMNNAGDNAPSLCKVQTASCYHRQHMINNY